MRKFLFTLLLLLAGYIGYMYFFGKGDDKENARVIVSETKDVAKAVGDFLKRQKDKYDDGEFDRLIDRVGKTVDKLKSSSGNQVEVNQTLRELEKEVKQIDPSKLNEENKQQLRKVIQQLEEELNQ